MSDKTDLGNRMKLYEAIEAGRRCVPLLPICARIDGKCFSTYTRGLKRPYDIRLARMMTETTKYLVGETHAKVGYTQSDEISLLFYSDCINSQVFLDGRIQKLTSILASMATAKFNSLAIEYLPEKAKYLALFDCRIWTVPTKTEAANTFLWREQDATKNSISMAARNYYSHKELYGKNGTDMQEMLFRKGINWNDYPSFFKRGRFVQRKTVKRVFSAEEIANLPAKHEARKNPDLLISRSEIQELSMPPFGSVNNRVEVLFDGAAPIRG